MKKNKFAVQIKTSWFRPPSTLSHSFIWVYLCISSPSFCPNDRLHPFVHRSPNQFHPALVSRDIGFNEPLAQSTLLGPSLSLLRSSQHNLQLFGCSIDRLAARSPSQRIEKQIRYMKEINSPSAPVQGSFLIQAESSNDTKRALSHQWGRYFSKLFVCGVRN